MTSPAHQWRFFRAGGFDQVRLDTGDDLMHLDQLDQKLWVALSCPVSGLEFDAHTLALLDTDNDGHVRANDLIAACQWTGRLLRDRDLLAKGASPLPLAAIDDSSEEGRLLLASAKHILQNLGKDSDSISAEDTADSARIFAATRFNGDGIIIAGSTDDDALKAVIADIAATYGSRPDRSGEAGIGKEESDAFFADLDAFAAWLRAPESNPALRPLGDASGAAAAALAAVRSKVEDYFARCRLAEFDPRAGSAMNGSDDDFRALAQRTLAPDDEGFAGMATLPLARIEAGRPLPLTAAVNPAWTAAVAAFREQAVTPLLGTREALSEAEWRDIVARLAAHAEWLAARPATRLDAIGDARVLAIAAQAPQAAIAALIEQDLALAGEAEAITAVDRLVCFARDLGRLANNFVSFRDFYTGQGKAVFQAGTLYLDGRSCDLVVPVLDAAKHATLASLSGIYLAYCDCTRGAEKKTIAAAFTAGDSDQLMAGRNGVFYDRDGRDWDATITRIAEHPISIRQAFWSPYKKAAKLIAEQVHKFTAAKGKGADDALAAGIGGAEKQVTAGAPAPATAPAPFDVAKFAGIFAAIGLAVGAIGTAVAAVVTGFLGLHWWQMPLALGGLLLIISGPAMAMAWFKLRNRNLGPLLDANGWAVNARARINLPFGTSLTQLAKLPDGAERALSDPYADKKTPWKLYLAALAVALVLLVWATKSGGI